MTSGSTAQCCPGALFLGELTMALKVIAPHWLPESGPCRRRPLPVNNGRRRFMSSIRKLPVAPREMVPRAGIEPAT
jgi:hypothetical protein